MPLVVPHIVLRVIMDRGPVHLMETFHGIQGLAQKIQTRLYMPMIGE
jgi:hypothetical protein